ncbi:unnamed protein product [Acanthoscelides obtectus]|nr:unnamed protein product [Acanthoscelides obtectus]CAK1660888.1 hypothetical protein AOBTE_LOCUS22316 [Acanthoscelides obtectus]
MEYGNEECYSSEQPIMQQQLIFQQSPHLEPYQAFRENEPEYQEQLQVNSTCLEQLASNQKEMEKQQESVEETEIGEKNMTVHGTGKLEYQDVDDVLRGEMKMFSMVGAKQLAKLTVVEQTYKDISGENSHCKEIVNQLKERERQLNEMIQQSEGEVGNMYQTVERQEKIIQQLKEYVAIIEKAKERITLHTNEYYDRAKKFEKDVQDWKSVTMAKIRDLRSKIEAKKQSTAALSDHDETETNKKVAEIRERNAGLEARYQELLGHLAEKKEKVNELRARHAEIIEKTKLLEVEICNLEDPTERLDEAKKRKIVAEKNKQIMLDKLQNMREDYIAKIEEKNKLITRKYEMDKRESKLSSIRVLDEKIEIQKQKIEELDKKIAAPEQNEKLDKVSKEKAYLEASKIYLEQKYDTAKTEADNLSNRVEGLRKEGNDIKEKIAGKQKELSKIKTVLEMSNNNVVQQKPRLNYGILKPTQRPKSPVSPKKVTFTGVSSSESSQGEANIQPPAQGSVFDTLLADYNK